jgi:hypothetical protein
MVHLLGILIYRTREEKWECFHCWTGHWICYCYYIVHCDYLGFKFDRSREENKAQLEGSIILTLHNSNCT